MALSSSRFLGFFQLPCLPQLRRCSTRSFTDIRLCFVCNFGDLTPTHGPVRPLHSGVNRKEVTGAPRRLLRHQLRCDRGGSSGEGSRINVGRTRTRSSAHGQCVLGSVRHRAAARLPAGASGVFKCEYRCVRSASAPARPGALLVLRVRGSGFRTEQVLFNSGVGGGASF